MVSTLTTPAHTTHTQGQWGMALAVWLRRWLGTEAQVVALHALGSQHDALCAQVAAQAERLAVLERDAERMSQSVAKCVLAAELAQRSEARMRARLEQGEAAWGVGDGGRVGLDNDLDTLDTP